MLCHKYHDYKNFHQHFHHAPLHPIWRDAAPRLPTRPFAVASGRCAVCYTSRIFQYTSVSTIDLPLRRASRPCRAPPPPPPAQLPTSPQTRLPIGRERSAPPATRRRPADSCPNDPLTRARPALALIASPRTSYATSPSSSTDCAQLRDRTDGVNLANLTAFLGIAILTGERSASNLRYVHRFYRRAVLTRSERRVSPAIADPGPNSHAILLHHLHFRLRPLAHAAAGAAVAFAGVRPAWEGILPVKAGPCFVCKVGPKF